MAAQLIHSTVPGLRTGNALCFPWEQWSPNRRFSQYTQNLTKSTCLIVMIILENSESRIADDTVTWYNKKNVFSNQFLQNKRPFCNTERHTLRATRESHTWELTSRKRIRWFGIWPMPFLLFQAPWIRPDDPPYEGKAVLQLPPPSLCRRVGAVWEREEIPNMS